MNSFIQMSDATNQDATCRACDVSTWRGLTQVTTTAVWSVNTANLFNLLSIRQWGVARHIRHSGHLSFCLRSRHLVCSCHWRQFINYRCIRRSIIYQMRTMTDYWSTGWLLSLWFVTVFWTTKAKRPTCVTCSFWLVVAGLLTMPRPLTDSRGILATFHEPQATPVESPKPNVVANRDIISSVAKQLSNNEPISRIMITAYWPNLLSTIFYITRILNDNIWLRGGGERSREMKWIFCRRATTAVFSVALPPFVSVSVRD